MQQKLFHLISTGSFKRLNFPTFFFRLLHEREAPKINQTRKMKEKYFAWRVLFGLMLFKKYFEM